MNNAFAALSGVLFGAGLAVSDMTNPSKVLSFLDITGAWDPSLALVMGAALTLSSFAFALARRRQTSLLGAPFEIPESSGIDRRLLVGAALFGAGWGMAGLCPGPAIAASITGELAVWVFVGSMAAGMLVFGRFEADFSKMLRDPIPKENPTC